MTIPAIEFPASIRRRERALAELVRPRPPLWLWLTFPLAGLAFAASVLGILVDRVYGKETEIWAAQAAGQDIANLVVFPALVGLAVAARRGSLHAYLGMTGLLGYSAYTYGLYAFDIHFGRLFLCTSPSTGSPSTHSAARSRASTRVASATPSGS
jgi:hypothetical protein